MGNQSRKSHHNLILWQKAVDLASEACRITSTFPRSEVYSLASQMRRAAVSVPSNIAEGAARLTLQGLIDEVGRVLQAFINSLRERAGVASSC